MESVIQVMVLQAIVTVTILAAEAIVYRHLRKRFYNMTWVWINVIVLYITLIILPIILVFLYTVLPLYVDHRSYVPELNQVREILFWAGIVISHFFFVLTIVYGFRKKKIAKPVQNEPAHLLDEFHE